MIEQTVSNRIPERIRQHLKDPQITGPLFVLGLIVVLTLTGSIELLARNFARTTMPVDPLTTLPERTLMGQKERRSVHGFTFEELDIHPDLLYQPYTSGAYLSGPNAPSRELVGAFRDFLNLFEQRQGKDDNFTIRVVDGRSGETLEVYGLDAERSTYKLTGRANWDRIDLLRRDATSRLLKKYRNRGIPSEAITIRWGRANQIREARERDQATIEYEVRLARYLGLSLLATEIGTVETFNQDHLVSSVGARSRYQLMPDLLKRNGINRYVLRTAGGKNVAVFEEWNPLLTMEPSMLTIRAYANAVGHELPGISAYHTGPGNLFTVYRQFLTNGGSYVTPTSGVMEAYMWAITDGYPVVSNGTSFKTYSRSYVASAYGALRATDDEPVDTTKSIRAERVQLREGAEIVLSQLLSVLNRHRSRLVGLESGESMYHAFRRLNPQIELPASSNGSVPLTADVRLKATVGGVPVRVFLPLGASEVLESAGLNLIDPGSVFRYSRSTFGDPTLTGEKTSWDREYDELVQATAHFGFTYENRDKLIRLKAKFEELAAENPTHYRNAQLEVIRIHASIWRTSGWEKLADLSESFVGRAKASVLFPAL